MSIRRLAALLAVLTVALAACGTETSVFDLGVGDCFNDDPNAPLAGEVSSVATVSCSEPHDNEIYHEYSMTQSTYPGLNPALEEAAQRCYDAFAPFVGTAYEVSELDFFPITPTSQSWADGDRLVYCVLYAFDLSKLTGSMRGSLR